MAGLVLPTTGQANWDTTLNNALLYLQSTNSSFGTFGRTTVASVDYTATTSDRFIAYTSLANAHTVFLVDATLLPDTFVVVKDESGQAALNPITVKSVNNVQTIDGNGTETINSNYGSKRFYSNGTQWFLSA